MQCHINDIKRDVGDVEVTLNQRFDATSQTRMNREFEALCGINDINTI